MNFSIIVSVAVAATFGAVSLLASGLLALIWPAGETRLERLAPARRARWLFALRLSPTALALLASVSVTLPSFLEFEPRDTNEVAGRILSALAAAGAGLLAFGLARAIWSAARAKYLVRRLTASATPVVLDAAGMPAWRLEIPVPVVALRGWRRPRLYVSGAVLDACAPRLLAAMAAHETGHHRAADNLKSLLLSACADPLVLTSVGRRMAVLWETATEEAADDAAVRGGTRPADLVDALLAVARLGTRESWARVPAAATAFYRGECLERRVRRLLDGPSVESGDTRRGRRRAAVLILSVAWLLAAEALHRPVFRLVEQGVEHPSQPHLRALVVGHPRA
jgi:hypothetical protein